MNEINVVKVIDQLNSTTWQKYKSTILSEHFVRMLEEKTGLTVEVLLLSDWPLDRVRKVAKKYLNSKNDEEIRLSDEQLTQLSYWFTTKEGREELLANVKNHNSLYKTMRRFSV